MAKTYKGWIAANESDRELLERLSIQTGEYDPNEGRFNDCVVTEDALEMLDTLWRTHGIIWFLPPVEDDDDATA